MRWATLSRHFPIGDKRLDARGRRLTGSALACHGLPRGRDGGEKGEEDEVSGNPTVAAAARTEARPRRAGWLGFCAFAATIALLAAQALIARRLELTFDEAYYTLWSRALSFGYLDHPPMVALFIRASTALFGGSEIGVRALSLLVVGAMPALIALIAWRLVRLGGEGRACGADVGRDAAGPRRRGLRHPRRAAGGVLDPRPCGSRRALAHRRGALAGRARAGARAGAGIEVHRRLFRRRGRPGSGRRAVAAPLARLAGAVRRTCRRAGDFRPLRRLERRARLGDFRQAARTRAAARFCALLYRRIPCFSGRPHQPARLRRPRPRRRDHPVAHAGFAPLARRGPARPRLHDRAGGGLFPSPLDPRPCPGQLARAALSGGGDSGRRLGRRGPPRRRFGPLRADRQGRRCGRRRSGSRLRRSRSPRS